MQILRDVTTTVAPSATIVTLQTAKDYLRVDYSEDDTLITNLIETARISIHNAIVDRRRAVLRKARVAHRHNFGIFNLPLRQCALHVLGPVIEVPQNTPR